MDRYRIHEIYATWFTKLQLHAVKLGLDYTNLDSAHIVFSIVTIFARVYKYKNFIFMH